MPSTPLPSAPASPPSTPPPAAAVPVQPAVPALMPTYAAFPFVLARGEGDRVFDDQGRAYWDFYGGHCVCGTGHGHPRVTAAVTRQAGELLFYSTAGTLSVRTRAAEALLAFAQSEMDLGLRSVFFCNSGAEANENALKMALKLTGRSRLAAFQGGWHGRTLLALSVTDDPKITRDYEGLLAPCDRLPWGDMEALEAFDFSATAAAILEPIQSMAGIRTAPTAFFRRLRERTREAGTLLVLDEIQTGMGRLGHPFAASRHGVAPDFITVAKGLASGVPMGALLLSGEMAARLGPGDLGSTFGGSPLACAALLATLEILRDEDLPARALACEAAIREGLAGSCVTAVQGEGLLLGLRVPDAPGLKAHLLAAGILAGGSSDPAVLRLMPPLVLTGEAIRALCGAVHAYSAGVNP